MAEVAPLAAWCDTPTRQAIVEFVDRVTIGPDAVPVEERIAVFDNDGTLWTEKPMPVQLIFILKRLTAMAESDPSLRAQQPRKAAYEKDYAWLAGVVEKHYDGDDSEVKVLMVGIMRAFAGMEVEAYAAQAAAFVGDGVHPTLRRPFGSVTFQPMVELLRYLESKRFTVFIASGGDRDFMRGFAADIYGIPPERIIGSSNKLEYVSKNGGSIIYAAAPDVFDDGPAKPIRIWSRVGRRPLIAAGNSNGDVPMLEFAGGPGRPALRLVVKHDDAEREAESPKGAESALERAATDGWTVISVKDDWKVVFSAAT